MTATKSPRRAKGSQPKMGITCKTCTPCRQKKVKCDGARPKCHDCDVSGIGCVYPRDARRELRPSRARVQSLENTVAVMLEHMKASGIVVPEIPGMSEEGAIEDPSSPQGPSFGPITPRPLPTPSASTTTQTEMPNTFTGTPAPYPADSITETNDRTPGADLHNSVPPNTVTSLGIDEASFSHELDQVQSETEYPRADSPELFANGKSESGLSPCEARVAGVFHEHGCVSSVHGLAGIMNPTCRERHKENISKIAKKGEEAISESKARLISNAVLQKQREVHMFRQPQNLMDLDGCDPELAKHLLDLHFNRQHYAYLITYRPAIMDSLASGGGPWANKLLLNAIFYSSALYSDREYLRSDPNDAQSAGYRFYSRFKHLLVEEIGKPTIPSAVALLLTSASLTSQGRSSAGWTLSGTAYRMILDLGCHMMLGPDYQSIASHDSRRNVQRDLEQEMRKRLYWGAYVTDATQALYLGRPCMFTSVEARVPLQLLDTFEELEDWQPYCDIYSPPLAQPSYNPQSAHAVSTFTSLAQLLQISTRITDLYGIQSIKLSSEASLERKRSIEWELDNWRQSLPDHLRTDLNGPFTPPPHQLTPHTTFHALTILLHRAFLEEGHLRRHSDNTGKKNGEEACIQSALMIQKYVRMYREAFTLRRAPFLLSYAVYSAVTVILRQERHDRGRFTEPISFFWTCLHELQRGCNFGLQKPLAILKDMVRELQVSINEGGFTNPEQIQPSFDDSLFSTLSTRQDTSGLTPQTSISSSNETMMLSQWDIDSFGPDYESLPDGMLSFLNDQEKDISQDTLYGLFAPSQNFR